MEKYRTNLAGFAGRGAGHRRLLDERLPEADQGEGGRSSVLTALTQLGILYIVALFVERSLEVLIKAWHQGGKSCLVENAQSAEGESKAKAEKALEKYKAGTQRRALHAGLTLGILVSLSGARLLGPIFEFDAENARSFQQALFQPTDIIVTAGLICDDPRIDGTHRRIPEKEPRECKQNLTCLSMKVRWQRSGSDWRISLMRSSTPAADIAEASWTRSAVANAGRGHGPVSTDAMSVMDMQES